MISFEDYFKTTRNGLYGLILGAPLLLLYEALVYLADLGIRNSADVILVNWLRWVRPIPPLYLKGVVLLTILALAVFFNRKKKFKLQYAPFLISEAMVYSFLLGLVITKILQPFMNMPAYLAPGSLIVSLTGSIGAGVYEEFLFRAILFGGIFFLAKRFLSTPFAWLLGAAISSALFAAYHYTGPMGDSFNLYTFAYRGVAGLLFCWLYYLRGFAVAAYTHAFYNIWIFLGI